MFNAEKSSALQREGAGDTSAQTKRNSPVFLRNLKDKEFFLFFHVKGSRIKHEDMAH